MESLNIRAISNKGFGNGKATLDNGYGLFLSMLEYKLAERGKYFVKVDKYFPSLQICHFLIAKFEFLTLNYTFPV